MYEIFVMNWEHRLECAESFSKWSKNKKGYYIDLSNDYENIWSVRDKNKVSLFEDYLSGYVVAFKDTFKFYHNAAELNELLKDLREGKDFIYYNLTDNEKYSILEKIKAGDTCLLTKKDMRILEKVLEKCPEVLEELKKDENKYEPYSWEDKFDILGKVVKSKDGTSVGIINCVDLEPMTGDVIVVVGNRDYQVETLLNDFTYSDDSPCGKKIRGIIID